MYIYTKDKNQIIGPYTWNENKDRLLTHLIFSNEIIIELNHNKGSKDNIFISDIGIGVRDVSYFTDMIAKEEIKIETEFKKNQTQSSSFCDTVELYRTYCSDLLDTGYTNGIRNLKNANCSQFDLLEKQKRAVCVVITRTTSSSEWWVGKSGILINPVTDTCKAYILTCAHCTGVDTTETYDYAVRFNWLRKECDIPSNMPNCDTDYIPWFNLIDIDEVRDYCSLTLKYAGKPPGLGWFPDLALLEMDDMPTYKEYFNGWRIVYAPSEGYWDYNLGTYKVDADAFILGHRSQNPMVARELNYYGTDGNNFIGKWNHYNPNDYLISGYSGSSIIDSLGYLLGINYSPSSAFSTVQLLLNSTSKFKGKNLHDFIDPYKLKYHKINSAPYEAVLHDGEERWEKSNCYTSNIDCHSNLNVENFIDSVFTESEECCFKLKYIGPTYFVGGVPSAIRIYRNHGSQSTLYYDKTSASGGVFGDSLTYEEIEFCINSNDLYKDGGEIVIEFLDNNGKIICRKVVSVKCTSCPCPEDLGDFLTVYSVPDSTCDSSVVKCRVFHMLDLPENDSCFKYISVFSTANGTTRDSIIKSELDSFNITSLDKCIFKGEEYEITVKLYTSLNDTTPCEITKSTYCFVDDIPPPCVYDCPDSTFKFEVETIVIPSCPGCLAKIGFWYREKCDDLQEIQIATIEIINLTSSSTCGCNLEDFYYAAIDQIIKINQMDFDPLEGDNNCYETWRISQYSCWTPNPIQYYSPFGMNSDGTFSPDTWVSIFRPCQSECCARKYRVCRDGEEITIEDLGNDNHPDSCDNSFYVLHSGLTVPPFGVDSIQCVQRCDLLEGISDTSAGSFMRSYDEWHNHSNDYRLNEFTKNDDFQVLFYNNLNELLIRSAYIEDKNISIEIYNINGSLYYRNNFYIGANSEYKIILDKLSVGTYFIRLIDSEKLYNAKFIKF